MRTIPPEDGLFPTIPCVKNVYDVAGHKNMLPIYSIFLTLIDKYVNEDIADVSDVDLLRIPPLSTLGTQMELAKAFRENPEPQQTDNQTTLSKNPQKTSVSAVLKELQSLLYSIS